MFPIQPKHTSYKSNLYKEKATNTKFKEDQAYDGDTESCSNSIKSFHSSPQIALMTNEKKNINYLQQYNLLNHKSRYLKRTFPDIPESMISNIFNPSEIVAVPLSAEYSTESFLRSIPSYPNKPDYQSSIIAASNEFELYPEERWKTLIAAILAFLSFIVTLTSLVLTHERLPDRNRFGPLPDVVLDNLAPFDWALDLSEYIIVLSLNAVFMIVLFHKHRFIVLRRLFLIMAILYLYRAITMYITVLPIASRTYFCAPQTGDLTIWEVVKRVFTLMSGFGLSINGKHVYCGDFIYSGHTVSLVMSYLTIAEYTPEKCWFLQWTFWILAFSGIIFLQFAHGHYTIDVVVAYYVTTRIFWTYHSLANNIELQEHSSTNYYSREWWFRLFRFFEKNVGGRVPNDFDFPVWWPKQLTEEET